LRYSEEMKNYFYFWGKAAGELPGEPTSHPLAYHSLEVAAVADVLLQTNTRKLGALACLLQTSPENARGLIVSMIALHDIGKFSTGFQSKCRAAWPTNILGEYEASAGGRHDADGYAMGGRLNFRALFNKTLSEWKSSDIYSIWAAITGHHGQPATEAGADGRTVNGMKTACWEAAQTFCSDVNDLFAPLLPISAPDERNLAILSWALAGLTVIADWIGSNRSYFPYRAPAADLSIYWEESRAKAEKAVARAGVLPVATPLTVSPVELLPKITDLSPLQRLLLELPLPDSPILAIVEDVTGSGKTEAALLLAARLLSKKRAHGLFFALPTMATANAIYERLGENYRRLFLDDTLPSLVLAHGKRKLHNGFTASILDEDYGACDALAEAQGNRSGAACTAWIADDRRKAFLAHVGVGTIDQAILGVLPSRHQSLRLWGLSDRVLIVDEAHAYDAYMGREIETLLEFHAALAACRTQPSRDGFGCCCTLC